MRNQARKWQKIVMLVFIIIIFVLVYFYSKYQNFAWNTKISETREITIEKWDNFSTLWVKIPEFNNIFYKLYIRNNPPDFNLIEGKYQLKEWQNVLETFESLKKPVPGSQNITILEWWNIYDIDKTLESKGLIKAWEFVSYAKNKEKIKALSDFFSFLKNDKLTSLEWYLYPDTYRIDTANFKINNFTVMLLENFEKKEKGYIKVNEKYQTSLEKVFAGGDIIGTNSTVAFAVSDGLKASKEIKEFLLK